MSATVSIKTYSSADFRRVFIAQLNGGGYDLTGATMKFVIRKRAADATALITCTETDGITIADQGVSGDEGKFTLVVTKTQLQQKLVAGEYVHELTVTKGGTTWRVWGGPLEHEEGPAR